MASISGTFRSKLGTSRIDSDVLAVDNGLPNEFVAATNQANNAGLEDGDGAIATGGPGHVGNKPVFLMTSIQPMASIGSIRPTLKAKAKTAKKKAKKKAKKSTPKTSAGTAKRKRRPKKR